MDEVDGLPVDHKLLYKQSNRCSTDEVVELAGRELLSPVAAPQASLGSRRVYE